MMKSGYLLAGIRPGPLAAMIRRRGISFYPRYLARTIFLLQGGIWSALLARKERRLHAGLLADAAVPRNPIIIVGHWRTGSTFLHQLLNRDSALAAPTIFQCCYPDSFMVARRFAGPVLKPFIKGHRPMDNVKVGLDEPHEDEYALIRLCGHSPLEKLVFQRSKRYFLADDETFLPEKTHLPAWEEAITFFVKKLSVATGLRPVLKNPFHSLRVPILNKLFPEATFINICRDPRRVIPSTLNMWTIFGRQNAMRKEWRPPKIDELISVYDRIWTRLREDLGALPPHRSVDIRFEALEKAPVAELERAYAHLGMDFTPEYRQHLEIFLSEIAGYRKNTYDLDAQLKDKIETALADHMMREGYTQG